MVRKPLLTRIKGIFKIMNLWFKSCGWNHINIISIYDHWIVLWLHNIYIFKDIWPNCLCTFSCWGQPILFPSNKYYLGLSNLKGVKLSWLSLLLVIFCTYWTQKIEIFLQILNTQSDQIRAATKTYCCHGRLKTAKNIQNQEAERIIFFKKRTQNIILKSTSQLLADATPDQTHAPEAGRSHTWKSFLN